MWLGHASLWQSWPPLVQSRGGRGSLGRVVGEDWNRYAGAGADGGPGGGAEAEAAGSGKTPGLGVLRPR